jgi:SAM-dependent methyltransferase
MKDIDNKLKLIAHKQDHSITRKLATALAGRLHTWRAIHERHADDWQMGGSLCEKIAANLWLLLRDYGAGEFPPKKDNREAFFDLERNQFNNITCESPGERFDRHIRKPFADNETPAILRDVARLVEGLESRGVKPPSRILELGCGGGWLLEMLAQHGYRGLGVTIIQDDVDMAKRRARSLLDKGLDIDLQFLRGEMEKPPVGLKESFNVALFYGAIHHAFDWKQSLESAVEALSPGGWLVLANEPSLLHTFVAYRSARILKTTEVGFRRIHFRRELKRLGLQNISITQRIFPRLANNSIQSREFWIYAQKPHSATL